jgi:hypothetical protein
MITQRAVGRTDAVTPGRERRAPRWALGAAVAAAWVLATALPGAAQAPVRIMGAVQWVSTTRMAVMTELGDSIIVDLVQADQATYRGLRTGDWVLVDGTLSLDRRRVIAQEVWRDNGRGAWTQSP